MRSPYNPAVWSTDLPFGWEAAIKFITFQILVKTPLNATKLQASEMHITQILGAVTCQDVVSPATAANPHQCCCHVAGHIQPFHLWPAAALSPQPLGCTRIKCFWDPGQPSPSPGTGTGEATGNTTASFGSAAQGIRAKQETAFQDALLCQQPSSGDRIWRKHVNYNTLARAGNKKKSHLTMTMISSILKIILNFKTPQISATFLMTTIAAHRQKQEGT